MNMDAAEMLSCDVLVAGAGLAGMRAAFDCAKAGLRVLWTAKGTLCSGSSFYPLTPGIGCQLPDGDADKETFLDEILDAGQTMADEEMCRALVNEITSETERLSDFRITPFRCTGRAACFAKRERIILDWTGWDTIRENVRQIFGAMPNVTVREHCDIVRILKDGDAVSGAILCNAENTLIPVSAPAVILATGGLCRLYQHSLNTPDVCGLGQSIALDAGAELVNIEFMQFIPGLMTPVYAMLFSEASLWHCTDVQDGAGRSIIPPYLPEGVSLHDCLMDRSMHGPYTTRDRSRYFEEAMMHELQAKGSDDGFRLLYNEQFHTDPNPYYAAARNMYLSKGIDPVREPITILPFAHCCNGGVHINIHAETAVPGLFAAGEAAGGLHGADRQGGLASAACLVYGAHAAASAVRYVGAHAAPPIDARDAVQSFGAWIATDGEPRLTPADVLKRLRHDLWLDAGIVRSGERLEALLKEIRAARRSYNAASQISANTDARLGIKAFHALRTAEALILAMLARKESRGPHNRSDYPNLDEAYAYRRVIVREARDGLTAGLSEGAAAR